jgi:hypothetical protein
MDGQLPAGDGAAEATIVVAWAAFSALRRLKSWMMRAT